MVKICNNGQTFLSTAIALPCGKKINHLFFEKKNTFYASYFYQMINLVCADFYI